MLDRKIVLKQYICFLKEKPFQILLKIKEEKNVSFTKKKKKKKSMRKPR